MKKRMIFLTIVVFAVTLAMPAWGVEQSTPGTGAPTIPKAAKQPFIQVTPKPVNKPDLVISISSLGSVYDIGKNSAGIWDEGINVAFTITNKGRVATGRAGSTFSVGINYTPSCQAPNCNVPVSDIGRALGALGCANFVHNATKTFHFSNPNLLIIGPPLEAGETRTAMGVLVLPGCLQYSISGPAASVYLIVDDKNQVDESNENNNKSEPISVSSKRHKFL
jgi:hypothetical protein